jgi:hypothetical protein
MRIFSLIPVLAVLATAVAALAVSRDVNPQSPAKRDFSGQPVARSVDGLSNGGFLRRGPPPPPKDPILRRGVFSYL